MNKLLRISNFLLFVCTSHALGFEHTIFYSCNDNSSHQKANGQVLGKDTYIELGAFEENFTPTNSNRALWKSKWTALNRTAYNTQNQFFEGFGIISSNAPPFDTNSKAWVWLFDSQGNWALYSSTAWLWPNTNTPSSFIQPLICNPDQSNLAVAGTVGPGNPEIICELVTDGAPPAVTYTQWAELLLPLGSRGKTTDFDADGQNNFLEYALGTNPNDRSSFYAAVQVRGYSGQSYLSARIQKGWTTGITYTVQWSDNLSNWYTSQLTTLTNNATLLEIRDDQPIGADPKSFMRVLISSPD